MFYLITIRVERVANQVADVSLAEFIFFAPGLDAREIEDVVDKRGQPLTLFANDAIVLLLLFLSSDAPEFQRFGVQPD